jgi:putative hemolysin
MWLSGIVVLLLLFASAFCSGSETALFSLRGSQVHRFRLGSVAQRRVARLIDDPNRTLVTLLLSNNIINIALSVLISAITLRQWGESGLGFAIPIVSALLILFGDILPKTVGLRLGARVAPWVAPTIEILAWVLTPIRIGVQALANLASRRRRPDALDRDELATLIELAREQGRLTRFEGTVLRRLLNFRELPVEKFLTPRVEVAWLDRASTPAQAAAMFRQEGVSRLIVTDGGLDRVVGVLLLKDFLTSARPLAERRVGELMRRPIFVPQSLPAPALFALFADSRLHLAIVLDEHGGTEGVVTLEDLLEALIGDIRDESDYDETELEQIGDDQWRCDALIELEELVEQIGWPDDANEDDVTLSGLLERELGRVPRAGDELRRGDFVVRVLTARPSRALLIGIQRSPASEA